MLKEIAESEVTASDIIEFFANEVRAKRMVDMIESIISEFKTSCDCSGSGVDVVMGPKEHFSFRNVMCNESLVKYNEHYADTTGHVAITSGVVGVYRGKYNVRIDRNLDGVEIRFSEHVSYRGI